MSVNSKSQKQIIVVAGPTSSGKSELAVLLAKNFNGEIISADSRQVYLGLDIGSGKVEGKWEDKLKNKKSKVKIASQNFKLADLEVLCRELSLPVLSCSFELPIHISCHSGLLEPESRRINVGFRLGGRNDNTSIRSHANNASTHPQQTDSSVFLYKGIPHYCIDYVDPRQQYSVSDFQKDGIKALSSIFARGLTPVIAGGTGHYIDALVFSQNLPEVPPNLEFRQQMEKLDTAELFSLLQQQDPVRSKNIDPQNRRRLIRALEIVHTTGKPVPTLSVRNGSLLSLRPVRHNIGDGGGSSVTKQSHSNDYELVGFHNPHSVIPAPEPESRRAHNVLRHVGQNDKTRIKDYPQNQLNTDSEHNSLDIAESVEVCFLYINWSRQELYQRIEKRLRERVEQGMVVEVLNLLKNGVTFERLENLGLEYRFIARFLQSVLPKEQADFGEKITPSSLTPPPLSTLNDLFLASSDYADLLKAIKNYSKRQETWFRRYIRK